MYGVHCYEGLKICAQKLLNRVLVHFYLIIVNMSMYYYEISTEVVSFLF